MSIDVIFDINEYGGGENAVQKRLGNTPGYYTVGSGWTNRGVVGCNKWNKKRKMAHKITCEPLIDRD